MRSETLARLSVYGALHFVVFALRCRLTPNRVNYFGNHLIFVNTTLSPDAGTAKVDIGFRPILPVAKRPVQHRERRQFLPIAGMRPVWSRTLNPYTSEGEDGEDGEDAILVGQLQYDALPGSPKDGEAPVLEANAIVDASTRISAVARGYLTRCALQRVHYAAAVIQAAERRHAARPIVRICRRRLAQAQESVRGRLEPAHAICLVAAVLLTITNIAYCNLTLSAAAPPPRINLGFPLRSPGSLYNASSVELEYVAGWARSANLGSVRPLPFPAAEVSSRPAPSRLLPAPSASPWSLLPVSTPSAVAGLPPPRPKPVVFVLSSNGSGSQKPLSNRLPFPPFASVRAPPPLPPQRPLPLPPPMRPRQSRQQRLRDPPETERRSGRDLAEWLATPLRVGIVIV